MNSTTLQSPQLYQAPILGVGASVRFSESGYASLGRLDGFGNLLMEGVTLGIDLQSEQSGEQILLGSLRQCRTGMKISLITSVASRSLTIHIQDDAGRRLTATAQLSHTAGKRLLIGVDPSNNIVTVAEMTIYSANDLAVTYSFREGPTNFSDLTEPLTISGAMIDGERVGSFVGRVANLFLARALSAEELHGLTQAAEQELISTYGKRSVMPLNIERRQLFRDDLTKLRRWQTQTTMSNSDTRDASTLLFKWLFDSHPLLLDLCDELGIQLSLPGASEEGIAYVERILVLKPSFCQAGDHGIGALHGHIWLPLSMFRNELAFHVEGHSVSHESFVKLVRHKLGGAHFDSVDRKKWQQDLKAY
ncbi:MAG: hypothetical protein EHM61_20660, partial [Acidobacteria bacterium]